jgi:hypothetical protein
VVSLITRRPSKPAAPPEEEFSHVAVIKLDLDRATGAVDRRILGGFTEHLGRCIYGGVFDEGSPLSDAEGFRTDVIEGFGDGASYTFPAHSLTVITLPCVPE